MIASINPANNELLKRFEELTDAEVDKKIGIAMEAYRRHRKTSFAERSKCMARSAEILEQQTDRFARTMTLEMGKTLDSARAEAKKCATACRYYAENAERFLADEEVKTNATRSFIHYQPIGPVLAVMPWNFPFWQVFRFAAPNLMAGNVGLLKHSSNVPQCALAIEEIFREAGFPEGVFQTLLIGSDKVARVLDDPRVVAATLTGSTPAGSKVASQSGKRIKKTVLELGGSDPFIVMPSADMNEASTVAVKARCINNGQSCIAAKRFIVAKPIAEEFTKRFVEGMRSLKVGDPMLPETEVGPLATPQIRDDIEKQVAELVKAGAKVLTGGKKIAGPGNFYEPTVVTHVNLGLPAYYEEIFGPVAMLFVVEDLDEAIRLGNDTPFGLGASLWSNDEAEKKKFIDEIEAGMAFVNGMVASDPRIPFGGVKESGYGRELGVYGLREFMNAKTVWVKEATADVRAAKTE